MSDSALPRFEKPEKPWRSITADKLPDISDTSTNVSAEVDAGEASEDDGGIEIAVAPVVPYQYADTRWMPMSCDASMPASGSAMSRGCDQAPNSFDGCSFAPVRWADQSMHSGATHAQDPEWRKSVMIRNMPNSYTRNMLLELVDSMGFAGAYDFVYLPIDFKSQIGLGYALINFISVSDAQRCFEYFEGYCNWKVPCNTVCTVAWSSPTQGLEAHIERYRNSPVMHHSLPDEWKPITLRQGIRTHFPPPSKAIKTPKVRKQMSPNA